MKKAAVALVLVLASLALVACGSSGSSSSSNTTTSESGAAAGGSEKAGGGSETISFEADPNGQLAYTTTTATAKAGDVTIDFNNPQALEHDVAIESSSGKIVGQTELVGEGSTSAPVKLKPGTYHYFCTVPGHREAGMEGTLTVK